MVKIEVLHETERVAIRLVTVPPGEKLFLQHHDNKHSLAIPLEHLETGAPFDLLVQYLLHHTAPKEYYSLYNQGGKTPESFLQLLWSKV